VRFGSSGKRVKSEEQTSMTKEGRDARGRDESLKVYSKPALVEYGRVEEITKGSEISQQDFGLGLQNK